MRTFLRVLAPVYAFFVALFTIFAWADVWNSANQTREFLTSSELLLFLVTLPGSSITMKGEQWAESIFSWPYADVAMLTLAGVVQVTLLFALAYLMPKCLRAMRNSSARSS
ncbi:hypothetical protein [Dyella sp. C11]|uniref:hypothetical protein n=1 Tax=Dyella sp. C11 TaxID=2126991 RepID=UPI000D642384|nr:hypothetical protein [Dyella sp. C11]